MCVRRDDRDFLYVVALQIGVGTGSPVYPIAIL